MTKGSELKPELGNPRRINLDEKDIREISIYELIERLSYSEGESFRLAQELDYDCYYMSYSVYEEDLKNKTFYIGRNVEVPRNGINFKPICRIKNGKIENLTLTVAKHNINLVRLYIDNLEGKNTIVHKSFEGRGEMPY